ncbi:MAG TPA: M3 family oligoendopeptidase [Tepidisphaeraceae bacterium]|jgi:oligoendopeptidase F
MVAQPKPTRQLVPADFNPAEWSQIEPLATKLQQQAIESPQQLESWLLNLSELNGVIEEYSSRRYIDKSCHTDDAEIKKRYFHFVEEIEPKLKPVFFELQKKFLESPHRAQLTDPRYAMLTRKWQADVDVFRPENVALETKVTKLVTEYDEISGAMTVDFRDKHLTLAQLGRFQEEPDRETRKEAFEVGVKRRMEDREKIDAIFDQLLPLRRQIAQNAGFPDYRAFTWKALKRFDYTPEDCTKFAEAIEKSIVPLVRALDEKRKSDLGVDVLRPWDLSVDPKSRPPLHPFDSKDIEGFVSTTKKLFERLSPALAEEFESLRTHGNLDLDSRRGKQPGGYQISLEESKQPFIFMNAAGSQRDVETLLHEGGHAFHFIAAANNEPLTFLRQAPMEFCEVASMAMEALSSEHFDLFYDKPENAERAKQSYLEGLIRFFPWMAIVDQFQHWLYTHHDHTRDERKAQWLSLLDRFGGTASWEGYEAARESSWQRQLHLFHVPFYYVEYGIAQLGAMQMWLKAKEDPQRALASYRAALKLGGTRPLPELFGAAGLKFDFTSRTIDPLIRAVHEELPV